MDFIFASHAETHFGNPLRAYLDQLGGVQMKTFSGGWGTVHVAGSDLDRGVYEDGHHLAVVAGSPVFLRRRPTDDSVVGAASMLHRLLEGSSNWVDEISGPFSLLVVDKETGEVVVVTDLLGFVPTYYSTDGGEVVLGTHVDATASCASRRDVDRVSVADFVLHGVVTYPYSLYLGLRQVSPGAKSTFHQDPLRIQVDAYWRPLEATPFESVGDAASELRSRFSSFIEASRRTYPRAAQFLSGGSDSRVLAGYLSSDDTHAYTFVDGRNRESVVAQKIAKAYSLEHQVVERSPFHYLENLDPARLLVGSSTQFFHAHSLGLGIEKDLRTWDAVYGGWFSDSLLKSSNARQRRPLHGLPAIAPRLLRGETRSERVESPFFSPDVLEELTTRRLEHLMRVYEWRPQSAHEWFTLWPATMRGSLGNYSATRRMFTSIEPFVSNPVVTLSAQVPAEWKLSGELFLKAFKHYLLPSKWIRHVNGHFPYFSYNFNRVAALPGWLHVSALLGAEKYGFKKRPHGSWSNWYAILASAKWLDVTSSYRDGYENLHSIGFGASRHPNGRRSGLSVEQHLNVLQLAAHFSG